MNWGEEEGTNAPDIVEKEAGNIANPLENIQYTDKVLKQATQADYHGFPECVDAFGANGNVTSITGGDRLIRTIVEISGGYMGKDGVFQYIFDSDGICNHRLFAPYK